MEYIRVAWLGCCRRAGWMMRVMDRLVTGAAELQEIDMLLSVTRQIEGYTSCALGDGVAYPVRG